jgi:hypothetical protein
MRSSDAIFGSYRMHLLAFYASRMLGSASNIVVEAIANPVVYFRGNLRIRVCRDMSFRPTRDSAKAMHAEVIQR